MTECSRGIRIGRTVSLFLNRRNCDSVMRQPVSEIPFCIRTKDRMHSAESGGFLLWLLAEDNNAEEEE